MPIKARTLVIGLVILDIIGSQLWPNDGIAHIAHIGGALVPPYRILGQAASHHLAQRLWHGGWERRRRIAQNGRSNLDECGAAKRR